MTSAYIIRKDNRQLDSTNTATANIRGSVTHRETKMFGHENSHKNVVNISEDARTDEPAIGELSESERIETAREMMAETPAEQLSLEINEVKHLTDDLLIEKTEDGFILYNIKSE
jgi:hypothetical protein